MPESLTKLQQKIIEVWKNLNSSQKNRVYLTSLILVIIMSIGIVTLTRVNYVELGRVIEPSQAQEIESVLLERGIKYKPGKNGMILVDSKQQLDAEWAIGASGVSEDISFEDTVDSITLTMTENDKDQVWQEYKKRSLIKKLKMFDNVKDADVDIAMSDESSYFIQDSANKTTAYVRITPIGNLTSEQVQGVVRVVASSVKGLEPENVDVVAAETRSRSDSGPERPAATLFAVHCPLCGGSGLFFRGGSFPPGPADP